jgi:hypothetical protein
MQTNIFPTLVAACFIALFAIIPFIYGMKLGPINTSRNKADDDESQSSIIAYYASLVVGCMLIALQLLGVIRFFFPKQCLRCTGRLYRFLTRPAVAREYHTKRAASRKINAMVQNAFYVHGPHEVGQKNEYSHSRALLNFAKRGERYKDVGFMWAWKSIWTGKSFQSQRGRVYCFDLFQVSKMPQRSPPHSLSTGSLFDRDGVWLSSRIISGNLSQVVACVLFISVLLQAVVKFTEGNQPKPCTIALCESDGITFQCVEACKESPAGSSTLTLEACVALHCRCSSCGPSVFLSNTV